MARTLHNNSYTNVKILHGGYDAWKSNGGPVEEKQTAQTSPQAQLTPLSATPTK